MGLNEFLVGKPNYINENLSFEDGSFIRVANPQMTIGRTRHSDGRLYAIMFMDVSKYYRPGDAFDLATPYKIVVEKELNPDGKTCNPITREEMVAYTCAYVGQILAGYHKNNNICKFIGRKVPGNDQMIISPIIQEMVDTKIEPAVLQDRQAKLEEARRRQEKINKDFYEKQKKEFAQQANLYEKKVNAKKQERLQSQKFDFAGVGLDGKSVNYNGVDLYSGDVLRVRDLCEDKDPDSNKYFYTSRLSVTPNEDDVEMLTSFKQSITFSSDNRVEDVIKTPEGKRNILELFAKGNKATEYGGEAVFMGTLNEKGEIVSTDLNDCSPTIQAAHRRFNQEVLQAQEAERKAYADALKRMKEREQGDGER